jgi:hypothetical protein
VYNIQLILCVSFGEYTLCFNLHFVDLVQLGYEQLSAVIMLLLFDRIYVRQDEVLARMAQVLNLNGVSS